MTDVSTRKLAAILETESGRKTAAELLKQVIHQADGEDPPTPARVTLPYRETYTSPESPSASSGIFTSEKPVPLTRATILPLSSFPRLLPSNSARHRG